MVNRLHATTASGATVLIAIGSNQGDSRRWVATAMAQLQTRAAAEFRASSLYRTAPVDCPPGSPPFINAAVSFRARPDELPESLLEFMQGLERAAGRAVVPVRNAPRVLDLDLILFGMEQRNTTTLVLPHPRARTRRFVLQPAAEIIPDQRWPPDGQATAALLSALIGR